jgi:ATP-dependent RNA helicase DDX19/DBP5
MPFSKVYEQEVALQYYLCTLIGGQNEEVLLKMGKYTGITSACTAAAETAGVTSSRRARIVDQVIIGIPGTLKRWMTKDKILSTKDITVLVFDEAENMLDQDGFQDDSVRILKNIQSIPKAPGQG